MFLVMIDGEFVKGKDARISVRDHGFLFGDSVYEVVRTRKGELFAAGAHFKRIHHSAEKIGLRIPWADDQLVSEMQLMVGELGFDACYLRLIITRGEGPLTLCPSGCDTPKRILLGQELELPLESTYRQGVPLAVSGVKKWRLTHSQGSIKTGNYLSHVLALQEARGAGCFEALLLNHQGQVAECTTSNIFWVCDKELYTPALKAGILKGVTRHIVLSLCKQRLYSIHEGSFELSHLLDADEAFITSTTFGILPISAIGEVAFSPGAITRNLMRDFESQAHLDLEY